MCLFKDRQESLWIGTFNEGAMLFNSKYTKFKSYLFHSEIRKEPLRVVGKLVEYKQQIWVGCNTGIFVIDLISGQWHRVNLDNQLEIDTNSEIYYVYRLSENQILPGRYHAMISVHPLLPKSGLLPKMWMGSYG